MRGAYLSPSQYISFPFLHSSAFVHLAFCNSHILFFHPSCKFGFLLCLPPSQVRLLFNFSTLILCFFALYILLAHLMTNASMDLKCLSFWQFVHCQLAYFVNWPFCFSLVFVELPSSYRFLFSFFLAHLMIMWWAGDNWRVLPSVRPDQPPPVGSCSAPSAHPRSLFFASCFV